MPKEQYPAPLKSGRVILEEELVQASDELARPTGGLILSGLIAGFAVGTSVFVMAVLQTMAGDDLPAVVLKLMLANAFTIGFIIVVLAHVDLFTEYTTLALLPVFAGKARLGELVRFWVLVYLSNQVAATAFAALVSTLGPALGVTDPLAFAVLAEGLTRHDSTTVLSSAALAGWMMGLLSWLVSAGRETISQVFFVWLITFCLALLGLHHCITGSIEVLAALFATPDGSWTEFFRFLGWTTLGNTLGGVIFAVMIRYSVVVGHRRSEREGREG